MVNVLCRHAEHHACALIIQPKHIKRAALINTINRPIKQCVRHIETRNPLSKRLTIRTMVVMGAVYASYKIHFLRGTIFQDSVFVCDLIWSHRRLQRSLGNDSQAWFTTMVVMGRTHTHTYSFKSHVLHPRRPLNAWWHMNGENVYWSLRLTLDCCTRLIDWAHIFGHSVSFNRNATDEPFWVRAIRATAPFYYIIYACSYAEQFNIWVFIILWYFVSWFGGISYQIKC